MEKTELKSKILECYYRCFYYYNSDFDSVMAQRCIEFLLLEDHLETDFNTAAMKLYNLYEQEVMVYEDQFMERDSVYAAVAWWYFWERDIQQLIEKL